MNGTPTVKIVERAALPQLSNWNFDCDSKSAWAGLSLKSRHYSLIGGRTQPIREDCRVFTLLSGDCICIVYIFAYRNNGALFDQLSHKVLTIKERAQKRQQLPRPWRTVMPNKAKSHEQWMQLICGVCVRKDKKDLRKINADTLAMIKKHHHENYT